MPADSDRRLEGWRPRPDHEDKCCGVLHVLLPVAVVCDVLITWVMIAPFRKTRTLTICSIGSIGFIFGGEKESRGGKRTTNERE